VRQVRHSVANLRHEVDFVRASESPQRPVDHLLHARLQLAHRPRVKRTTEYLPETVVDRRDAQDHNPLGERRRLGLLAIVLLAELAVARHLRLDRGGLGPVGVAQKVLLVKVELPHRVVAADHHVFAIAPMVKLQERSLAHPCV